jgi:adenylylsulfate kinase
VNFLDFIEIFLDVPLEELRRRDPKGIYDRFDKGEITNVAGLDLKVDFPSRPHLHFRFEDGLSSIEMVDVILNQATNLVVKVELDR